MITVTEIEKMRKKFGASGINRDMFLDCFEKPIHLENVSDEDMQTLANDVESKVREAYPNDADDLFRLWAKENLTDKEYDMVAVKYNAAWNLYWDLLKAFGGVMERVYSHLEEEDEE